MDYWNCFELSWLLPSGKPVVAIGEFAIPADSPNIIESKSFKLYLNSLNQTVFATLDELQACLAKDLSAAAGKPVGVKVRTLAEVEARGWWRCPACASMRWTCHQQLRTAAARAVALQP